MIKYSKGTKFSLAILTFFVGVLLVWFAIGGERDAGPEGVRPGFSTWGHVKNQGADPFLKHDSNGLLPLSERESQSRPPEGAIGEFEEWMERFLSEDGSGRGQLIEEGVAISGRRREEMKRLIHEDPETALALAVPYQFRRELPPEITTQLETPVSNFAQFQVLIYCSEPGHAGEGHAKSEYERIATFGGNRYEVHTFGRRFNVTAKDLLSIHGIAIDEVLAMADDPVRVLSESERADREFDAEIAVAVGGNVYGASVEEAVMGLRKILEEEEGSLGPLPDAGYRALQREEVEGVSLLFAAEPDEDIDLAALSEQQSSDHTLGPKTMLYIRVRFSDQEEDLEPIDLATLRERQALCEAFWFENSYGKSTLTTTFTDTVTLPEGLDHYKNKYYQIREDALPLVKAAGEAKGEDWDSENYDFHTVLTPDGDWEFGGLAGVGARDSLLFGNNASNVRTASHEFGHNLGLWHANYWRSDATSPIGRDSIPGGYVGDEEGDEWIEYGHRFSVMSGQDGPGYLNEGRGHYTAGEKVQLDWLVAGDGDWISVDQTTAAPIRLYRHDVKSEDFGAMSTGVIRSIKINLDSGDYSGNDKRRYWLSYRLFPVYDWLEGWLPYGIQVDWQGEIYGPDGSILLDMTPYTQDSRTRLTNARSPYSVDNSDKEDCVVFIGRTYSDKVADIHFTPIARGEDNPNEWIDVLIHIGTQEENAAPEITSLTASSTEVAPGEMVDFSVEAEDEDGDTLYYTWTILSPYHMLDIENLNSKTVSKSFSNAGRKNGNFIPVRVTVSDGKGGSDTEVINVIVGNLSDSPGISGRVISGGLPVEGAIVKLYSEWEDEVGSYASGGNFNAWTDSDGRYFLLHARDTESWLTVVKDGLRFRPLFSNPVYLAELNVTERDWIGFPNDMDRAPVVHLTSPNFPVAKVSEGSGLFLEAEISEGNFPNFAGMSNVSWSVAEAPDGGLVTFSPPHGPATVANFNNPGIYKIVISATNDGVNTGTREVFVRVGSNSSSEGEIIYFSMDEGEGVTVMDSRGGDNNCHLVNGADWTGPDGGISGTGIVLDGIDDEIHFDIGLDRDRSYERTISLWFKADDPLRQTKQVLYNDHNRVTGLIIYLEAGRLYVGGWTNEADDWNEIYLSTELADTNWHHVALTMKDFFIGTGAHHEITGFLDGREFGSDQGGGGEGNFIFWLPSAITLGANRGDTWYHDGVARSQGDRFGGMVDEFSLWKRALTPEEIGQIFRKFYLAPEVSLASVDHLAGSVVIPPGMGIFLDGSAKGNSSLETKWETVIAPEGGEVKFDNPAHPNTVATFSTPGYYKLRLSADDGQQISAIDIDVHAGLDAGSNFSSPQELVYYSMDEGSGETVGNSADGSRPGLLSNPSGWTSEGGGISGTAIQFDGIEDYLEMGNQFPTTKSSNAKSFALWMKPDLPGPGKKEIIFQKAGRHGGFYIYLDGNVLYFGGRNNTEIRWNTYLPVPITRGRWHHVALVFDPDESGFHHDGLRAYLNGRQVASGLLAAGIDSRLDQGTLGRQLDGSHLHDGFSRRSVMNAFSGILDEFHYYQDHALTIDEIGMLYAFGNVGPTVDAGPDQLAVRPYSMVLLEGSSTDDGRWASPVTHSWHIIDGPGTGKFRPIGDNGASAHIDFFEGGSYRIALGAYDGQVTTFDELMVTVRHPTQFERFMHGFPAIAVEDRGYHADPDGDYQTNLAEYALGGAPDVGETHYQLGLQHELVQEGGDWYAEFRYPRRRDAAERGLRYEFQVSDDLSTDSWTNRGYFVLAVTPIDEIFEEVRLTIADPIDSANSRIFGRVRVVIEE